MGWQRDDEKDGQKAGCVPKREQGSEEGVKRVKLPKVGIDHTNPLGTGLRALR